MNKALIVLAECVDVRNGRRFRPGEEFSPAPNPEQARRLVIGQCLPEEAIAAAKAAETEAEKAAEKKGADDRKAAEQAEENAAKAAAKRRGGK